DAAPPGRPGDPVTHARPTRPAPARCCRLRRAGPTRLPAMTYGISITEEQPTTFELVTNLKPAKSCTTSAASGRRRQSMWPLLLVVLVPVVQASAQSPPVVPFPQDYRTSLVKYAVVDRSDGLS